MTAKVQDARMATFVMLGISLIVTFLSSGVAHSLLPRLDLVTIGVWAPAFLTIALLLACSRRRRSDLVPWAIALSLAAMTGRRCLLGDTALEGWASAGLSPLIIQALSELNRVRSCLRQPRQEAFTLASGRDRRRSPPRRSVIPQA